MLLSFMIIKIIKFPKISIINVYIYIYIYIKHQITDIHSSIRLIYPLIIKNTWKMHQNN